MDSGKSSKRKHSLFENEESSFAMQISLLLKIYITLLVRQRWKLCLSLISGFLVIATLIVIRAGLKPKFYDEPTKFRKIPIDRLREMPEGSSYIIKALAYSPENEVLHKVMENAANALGLGIMSLPAEELIKREISRNRTIGGIVFDDDFITLTELPHKIKFKITLPSKPVHDRSLSYVNNWRTYEDFMMEYNIETEDAGDENSHAPPYIPGNFIAIQHAVTMSYIKAIKKNSSDQLIPNIVMQQFPHPTHEADEILYKLTVFYDMLMVIFAFPTAHIGSLLATEKRKLFRIYTAVIGIPNSAHWVAWFLCSFLYLIIFVIPLIMVLRVPIMGHRILKHISDSVLIVFFVIYIISVITFTFMISSVFSRKNIAYLMIIMIWLVITTTTYGLLEAIYATKVGELIIYSMYMNLILGAAMQEILFHNNMPPGLTWTNMLTEESLHPNFCFAYSLIALASSSVFYFLMTLFIYKINPGRHSIAEAWTFSMLLHKCQRKRPSKGDESLKYSVCIQTVGDTKKVSVKIEDLHKTFNGNVAIDNLSMNIYKDELTAIVTNYGGGKTVIVSLMTRVLTPTKGKVYINGENIAKSRRVRNKIGYTPAFDYFFDELTVMETITLFSRLKGAQRSSIQREITKYTTKLGLSPHLHSRNKNLYAPDKMKVSICNALCGGTKVIICDDPALHLDPESRELIWELLQMEKKGKTIIVFTSKYAHVDLFADRIGIMIKGSLKGYGDLAFLRKRLSGGYMLKIKKQEETLEHQEITNLLSKMLPNVSLEDNNEFYVNYVISEPKGATLEAVLKELNGSLNKYNIKDFGLHLQTLEELVLSSGKDRLDTGKGLTFPELKLYSGGVLKRRQWKALLYRKFVFTACRFKEFLAALLTFAIILAVINYNHQEAMSNIPEYNVGLDPFTNGNGFLEISKDFPEDSMFSKLGLEYEALLKNIYLQRTEEEFDSFILERKGTTISDLHAKDIIAATIKEDNITVWFNYFVYHTPPLSLNIMHNALARATVANDCFIEIVNAPAGPSYADLIKMETQNYVLSMQHYCTLAMAFITPLFIHQILREYLYGHKTFILQLGVKRSIYWASFFIWDWFIFIIMSLFLTLIIGCGETKSRFVMNKLGMYFFVFIFFGMSALSMTYLIAHIFVNKPNIVYVYTAVINIITGYTLCVINLHTQRHYDKEIFSNIFKIFPHYNLAVAMEHVHESYIVQHYCELMCTDLNICRRQEQCKETPECCDTTTLFKYDKYGIMSELTYFFFDTIIFLFLIYLYEIGVFTTYTRTSKRRFNPGGSFVKESARQEKIRILMMTQKEIAEHPLILDRVTKDYDNVSVLKQVTLGIEEGEIFGIVGPHGSGKTTLFRLITSQEPVTLGDVYFWGYRLEGRDEHYSDIGYSQQNNAGLARYLTGRDALQICCLIHGVRDKDIEIICKRTGKYLGLTTSLDKEIGSYDLNTKRKLGIAIAVIGNTSLIILDQPTEACSPAARMKIWDFITNLNASGRTIVFSSHSMIECFNICSRIAIMVNGEIVSVGTPEDHKHSVQPGIDVTVKIEENVANSDDITIAGVTGAKRLIERAFPKAILRVQRYGMFVYFIPYVGTDDWINIISLLERNKELYRIRSYYLNKTNIDVMFTQFASKQKAGRYLRKYK